MVINPFIIYSNNTAEEKPRVKPEFDSVLPNDVGLRLLSRLSPITVTAVTVA